MGFYLADFVPKIPKKDQNGHFGKCWGPNFFGASGRSLKKTFLPAIPASGHTPGLATADPLGEGTTTTP